MDDSHAYIVRRNSSHFPGFQLEMHGAGGKRISLIVRIRHHTLHNADTRCAPFDAGIHFHTVASEFRYLKPFPKPQAPHFTVAVLIYLGAKSGQSGSEPFLTEYCACQKGNKKGGPIRTDLADGTPGYLLYRP